MRFINVDCNSKKKCLKKTVEFEAILRKIRDKLTREQDHGE